MANIFFTSDSFKDFKIDQSYTSKTIYDVLEKVLCDGWERHNITHMEAKENELILTLEFATDTEKYAYFNLVVVSGIAGYNGDYRVVNIKNGKITLSLPDYEKIEDSSSKEINGEIALKSAGWSKLYKSANELVIRPPNELTRCFLFRDKIKDYGYIAGSINSDYSVIFSPTGTTQVNDNVFGQCVALRYWDDNSTLSKNYNDNCFRVLEAHSVVHTGAGVKYVTVQPIKPHQTAPWFIIVIDNMVYVGVGYADTRVISTTLYSFGINKNVNGMNCAVVSGLVNDNVLALSSSFQRVNYAGNFFYPYTANQGNFAHIYIESADSKSMFSYFSSNAIRYDNGGTNEATYEKFKYGGNYMQKMMINLILESAGSSQIGSSITTVDFPYMEFNGAYKCYGMGIGDTNMIHYETINNKTYAIVFGNLLDVSASSWTKGKVYFQL